MVHPGDDRSAGIALEDIEAAVSDSRETFAQFATTTTSDFAHTLRPTITLSCDQADSLIGEIKRLEGALQAIADGDIPRPPVKTPWRSDGHMSKLDTCPHDRPMFEDCGECVADYARAALQRNTDLNAVPGMNTKSPNPIKEA